MKKLAYIVSGIGLLVVWPFAGMMTGFMYDSPIPPPPFFAMVRSLLAFTLFATPVVWVASLVLSLIEVRRRKRDRLLTAYARSPYIAALAHLCTWIVAFLAAD